MHTERSRAFPGRIFIDHLPKTAGTAVMHWLATELGKGCINDYHLWGYHDELIRRYGGRYSIISAHAYFRDAEGLDPRYQYMTFFREPVDRVVSWLYFTLNDSDRSTPVTDDMVSDTKIFLESDGEVIPDGLHNEITNYYVEHFSRVHGTGLESDDEKFANSLDTIKRYDVVGYDKEMPRFLADVAELVGLPAPEKIRRVHVTSKRPSLDQVSPRLRERIKELNRLDIRLYEAVSAWKAASTRDQQPICRSAARTHWDKFEGRNERLIHTPDVKIAGATLRGGKEVNQGRLMVLDLDFLLNREAQNLEIGIHIFDTEHRLAFGTNSILLGQSHDSVPAGAYRVTYHLIADLPEGHYTAGFSLAEHLPESVRELAWRDVMCGFDVRNEREQRFAGYVYLPAEITLCPAGSGVEAVIVNAAGSMSVKAPVPPMRTGASSTIGVEISNRSEQAWVGNPFHPIYLSYHWLESSGNVSVYEGSRTALPQRGVGPGRSVETEAHIRAPQAPGVYQLVLTIVQEGIAWFESRGFQPAQLEVEVV
jgi:hypothetical protein